MARPKANCYTPGTRSAISQPSIHILQSLVLVNDYGLLNKNFQLHSIDWQDGYGDTGNYVKGSCHELL
jgi:hypothetical protein